MRKLKQELSAHWNRRFRFECREGCDIILEARRAFFVDGCMNLSAALAFYTILSLIPFLFLMVSGAAYLLGSSEAAFVMALNFFNQVFPHASSLVFEEVKNISQRAEVMGLVGFLSMIWTASLIFSSLEYAMVVVFRAERRRHPLKGKLLSLALVPGAALIFVLSFSVTALFGFLRQKGIQFWGIDLPNSASLEILIGYFFPYAILTLTFTFTYKAIPNTPISFHHALAGGASCALLFEAAKHLFTWYIRNYGRYGMTYGGLEAMVILVLWTFYSACIVLFCAEVVSAYRRRDVTLLGQAFI